MNLFGILTNRKVIKNMLEIATCGIFVNGNEYFIMIWLDKDILMY